ncbi:hypothetical protein ACPV5O_01520 [Vibrio maritimus]
MLFELLLDLMIEKKHLPEKSNPVMIFHDAHETRLEYSNVVERVLKIRAH